MYAEQGRIVTDSYCLLPVDLRDLLGLQAILQSAGFDPSVPTYVLAECVLVYMEPHESAALLRHLGQTLPAAVCVVYEQVMCASGLVPYVSSPAVALAPKSNRSVHCLHS